MTQPFDIFIIGGGINGCGIARNAAGRGLRVGLAEMNDLASATSSASTKLFHGGLRYLEYFEFNLVRHALAEREVLLRAMPHISWPMRFVLPYSTDMRFEGDTPTSKLLSTVMPWMRGCRPAWLIDDLQVQYVFLTPSWAKRLIRAYGTEAPQVLGDARTTADLGPDFGATLTGREVAWLMSREYARTAEDVVWRRSALGLRLSADQIAALGRWMAAQP